MHSNFERSFETVLKLSVQIHFWAVNLRHGASNLRQPRKEAERKDG
jgi:hypothetical protein